MSSYTQPNMKTFKSESALVPFSFTIFGTKDETVAKSAAAGRAMGVNMSNSVAINGEAEIALDGGGALIKLAATVVRGQSVGSDANGLGIVAAAGTFAPAIAHQSGVVGDVIAVIMNVHTAI